MEVWKKHSTIDNLYVSSFGNLKLGKRSYVNKFGIKRTYPIKLLKQHQTGKGYKKNKGYLSVHLKDKSYKTHRLVAETFIENKLYLSQVNHKDGNSLNNNADNLEWVSNMDNQHHRFLNRDNYTSKYIGVNYRIDRDTYNCELKVKGKRYRKTGFKTEDDAYLYLCELRKKLNIVTKYA